MRLSDPERSSRFMRVGPMAAAAFSTLSPIAQLGFILAWSDGGAGDRVVAVAATALYLPLHVRHVLYTARGRRPPGGGWTLTAMAVVMIGVLPAVGAFWLPNFHALAASALLVLRPPWSVAGFALVVAAQAPLALAFELNPSRPAAAYYGTLAVLWRASAVVAPVWLVGATRRLHEARLALAEEAVVQERLRIDAQLRRTLGAALGAIAAGGREASALAGIDAAAAASELRGVVERSRGTLGEARRVINGFRQASLRAELDTAATLLTAAGIDTRLVLPPGGLPDTTERAPRSALRSATARFLRENPASACVITVAHHDGQVRVDVGPDATAPTLQGVTVP